MYARKATLCAAALTLVLALVTEAGGNKNYAGARGRASTTMYWDCCKGTCGWEGNLGAASGPVRTCRADGRTTAGANEQGGCGGGNAYVCTDQQPFVKNNVAYGFAAANVNGLPQTQTCCACYKLTFVESTVKGKTMILQVINTGSDLGNNHFDIQVPATGMGIYTQGCAKQFPATPASKWGRQYGGVLSRAECDSVPAELRHGCEFRFDWFQSASIPHADFERVPCPPELTSISKCKRHDD